MYVEGLQIEGVLSRPDEELSEGEPPKTEFGKPQEMGPRKVDLSKLGQRQVTLTSVNWIPPELQKG